MGIVMNCNSPVFTGGSMDMDLLQIELYCGSVANGIAFGDLSQMYLRILVQIDLGL